jgi:hypothetical protein
MRYAKITFNDKGKASVCPICNNENTDIEGDYCQICGAFLRNECTNDNCKCELPGDSRYCSLCGSESTFYKDGLLKDWRILKDESNNTETFLETIDSDQNSAKQDFVPNYYLSKDDN